MGRREEGGGGGCDKNELVGLVASEVGGLCERLFVRCWGVGGGVGRTRGTPLEP